ncbi:MAG TPA: prepilin-type N-terminal cleavage/methylation domain-containing protein [Gemmatales bacterium]|nr:prepilin-type N-terminal cleavage/methylation domain-containing protein [Gemmatales bacterium]HMP59382.1 prepilin-type N-terminal cleavage/methylation domain-containing protein [Gemmatales bacterium]
MRLRTEGATKAATRAGFTLMELLVVVAILVVLVGVATPMYMSYLERSKVRTAFAESKMLAGVLNTFYVQNGELPMEGDWTGLPLEVVPPLDPWRRPYLWQAISQMQPDGTTILRTVVWSSGPMGNWGPEGEASSASR